MSADITARGRPEFNSVVAVTGGAVTVILDLLLIPRMGINGAALASSITYLLEAILIGTVLKHLLHKSWRSVVVPTRKDFIPYRDVWRRGVSLLRSAPVAIVAVRGPAGAHKRETRPLNKL
jgi:Na+-driven multidrug efflux pump